MAGQLSWGWCRDGRVDQEGEVAERGPGIDHAVGVQIVRSVNHLCEELEATFGETRYQDQ